MTPSKSPRFQASSCTRNTLRTAASSTGPNDRGVAHATTPPTTTITSHRIVLMQSSLPGRAAALRRYRGRLETRAPHQQVERPGSAPWSTPRAGVDGSPWRVKHRARRSNAARQSRLKLGHYPSRQPRPRGACDRQDESSPSASHGGLHAPAPRGQLQLWGSDTYVCPRAFSEPSEFVSIPFGMPLALNQE